MISLLDIINYIDREISQNMLDSVAANTPTGAASKEGMATSLRQLRQYIEKNTQLYPEKDHNNQ